jgi:hypothetical protein
MNININDIPFGNPTRTWVKFLEKDSILDTLLEELKNYPFPENDSDKVRTELSEIAAACQNLSNSHDAIEQYKIYDTDFDNYIFELLTKQGVNKEELVEIKNNIDEDVIPIIVKLKYHYQRLRPIQLSKILEVNLVPFETMTTNTPSYPSGHTIQSRIYAEVIGNKYPQFYKSLHDLATEIMWSRLYLGVHYPSDCQFADYIAQVICNHTDFKKKYKL